MSGCSDGHMYMTQYNFAIYYCTSVSGSKGVMWSCKFASTLTYLTVSTSFFSSLLFHDHLIIVWDHRVIFVLNLSSKIISPEFCGTGKVHWNLCYNNLFSQKRWLQQRGLHSPHKRSTRYSCLPVRKKTLKLHETAEILVLSDINTVYTNLLS